MTEKRLYALTDEQVETLIGSTDNWSRTLRMNNRESIQEDHAIAALTPLDTDDAVERMAGAAFKARCGTESFTWAKAGLFRKSYLDDARAALAALLGQEGDNE